MSPSDEVKVDMPPENDENEPVTSLQEDDAASNDEISEEIVQNKIFLPHEDQAGTSTPTGSSAELMVENAASHPQEDQIDDPKINEDLKTLYEYARDGHWTLAYREIFKSRPSKNLKYLTARISDNGDIALHVAVAKNHPTFVDGLVKHMTKEDLAIKNDDGNTAFFLAAASGRVNIAKKMFEKNAELPNIHGNYSRLCGNREMLPIHVAACLGHKMMVDFLDQVQERPSEEKEIFEDFKILYRLALKDAWDTAYRDIFKRDPEKYPMYLIATISDRGGIALHVAVAANSSKFVRRLVKYMQKEDFAIKNREGNTAFYLAALFGRVEFAKLMFKKNDELPKIRGSGNRKKILPIHAAAEGGHKQMLEFLYGVSKKHFEGRDLSELLCLMLKKTDLFDVALNLLEENQSLLDERSTYEALVILAGTPMMSRDFANQNQEGFLKRDFKLYSGSDKLPHEKLPPRTLQLLKLLLEKVDRQQIDKLTEVAVKEENVELLSIIICDYYPDLVLESAKNLQKDSFSLLIHNAILKRQESILKLINKMNTLSEINVLQSYTDDSKNNILHLAGKLPSSYLLDIIPGVALQMQYEIWWFKEVRKIVNASDAQAKNDKKKTPIALFNEEHKDLKEKGEKWMKDTANSCMIVAALIATVVFASAFTVPGGTKDESGTPHFLREVSFTVFVISDAVSLVSSICSILTFLSILTSRYAEEDFLLALPLKLICGLFTLLLSIVAMMVVFCTTIFIVFKDGNIWVPILVSVISSLPAIIFVMQQRKLLIDVVLSTYKIKYLSNEGRARELNKFSEDNDDDDDDDDDDISKDNRRWKYPEERYQYYKNRLQRCLTTFYTHCVRR